MVSAEQLHLPSPQKARATMPRLSNLAKNLTSETAFTVLALARRLKAQGKDVVELEIGDSPFPSTPHAKAAGIRAIEENQTGYCPSLGLPDSPPGRRDVRLAGVWLSRRAREHRRRLRSEAVRAVLRRGPARSRRRGPRLQPALSRPMFPISNAGKREPCWRP